MAIKFWRAVIDRIIVGIVMVIMGKVMKAAGALAARFGAIDASGFLKSHVVHRLLVGVIYGSLYSTPWLE